MRLTTPNIVAHREARARVPRCTRRLFATSGLALLAVLAACQDSPLDPGRRSAAAPRLSVAAGTDLRTLQGAYSSPCSINVGIAFDGTNLLVSCYDRLSIDYLSPVDGHLVSTLPITGASGYTPGILGAMAWDATRGQFWICSNSSDVALVDPATGVATQQFVSQGCFDGLAYDAKDNTLWASPDASPNVSHYQTDGTLIATVNVGNNLGGSLCGFTCGNSGIAVGGDKLYLANNGGSQIYEVAKDFSSYALFASFPRRLEDMECDDITFASQGTGAIWSLDAYDREIHAYAIAQGSCAFGGGPAADDQGPPTFNVLASISPVAMNVTFTLTANVDDATTGNSPIASAEYMVEGGSWHPMSAQDGAFDEVSEDVKVSFSIASPGVYDVCVRGTDNHENVGPATCILVVVYDPNGAFVTGGGWINSLAGAYTPDPTLAGRANFGFVSKYLKGASVPTGTTEFQFQAGDLNFHSSSYQWLVVATFKALYKGEGTVNGVPGYSFLLSAVDGAIAGGGGSDKLRMKIWNTASGVVLYDNQGGAADDAIATAVLGGGNIVIHAK